MLQVQCKTKTKSKSLFNVADLLNMGCENKGASAVLHRADDWRNKVLLVHAQHDGACVCDCVL